MLSSFRSSRLVRHLLATTLCGGLMVAHGGPARSAAIPRDIQETLSTLKRTFRGMNGQRSFGRAMEVDLEGNRGPIEVILGWALANDENSVALADHILGSLRSFTNRFRRGSTIDPEILATQKWVVGTEPGHGLVIGTYLLLEMAARKRSLEAARVTLEAAAAAFDAFAYLTERSAVHRGACTEAEVQDWKRRSLDAFGSGFGAQMAWMCEHFMLQRAPRDLLPEVAAAVCDEYVQWRAPRITEAYYHTSQQHRIMEFVRRFTAALPAPPRVARAPWVRPPAPAERAPKRRAAR